MELMGFPGTFREALRAPKKWMGDKWGEMLSSWLAVMRISTSFGRSVWKIASAATVVKFLHFLSPFLGVGESEVIKRTEIFLNWWMFQRWEMGIILIKLLTVLETFVWGFFGLWVKLKAYEVVGISHRCTRRWFFIEQKIANIKYLE